MKKWIAIPAAVFTFFSGLFAVLNPFWWLASQINPHSKVQIRWTLKSKLLYKLEILIQNFFGVIIPGLRRAWIQEIEKAYPDDIPAATPTSVPEFDWKNKSLDEFAREYRILQKPAVLRGFLKQDPEFGGWDYHELIQRFGEEEVTLTCPVKDGYIGKFKELNVPGVYLHNSEVLLKKYPDLYKKMGLGLIAKKLTQGLLFSGVGQIFVGRKKTGTWWHCAGGINFFLMLEGQKKWGFIDPQYSPLVFPLTAGAGTNSIYYISATGMDSKIYDGYYEKLSAIDRKALDEGQKVQVSEKMLKLFRSVERTETVLNPGDVLLIPAWWWHDVENITDTTVAVATRWFDPNWPTLANQVFDKGTRLNAAYFHYAFSNALEQTLVRKDKTLDLTSYSSKEVLTPLTRGNQITRYGGEVSEKISEYYKRFGYER
ncbi:MAG: cupin-like domain-containing protein [Bdellovibrionales bacterium]|nr:cupin-like domain-containing protein [Bdellovibrionales bacterium]